MEQIYDMTRENSQKAKGSWCSGHLDSFHGTLFNLISASSDTLRANGENTQANTLIQNKEPCAQDQDKKGQP